MSFLDQQFDEKGNPLGPIRYKNIVRERFDITKHTHISYNDTGKMTPLEREYILQFIIEDKTKQKEDLEKLKQHFPSKFRK